MTLRLGKEISFCAVYLIGSSTTAKKKVKKENKSQKLSARLRG